MKKLLVNLVAAGWATLSQAHIYTNLHSFAAGATDGQYHRGSLTLAGSTLDGMTTCQPVLVIRLGPVQYLIFAEGGSSSRPASHMVRGVEARCVKSE
jgi:hypothetical protein